MGGDRVDAISGGTLEVLLDGGGDLVSGRVGGGGGDGGGYFASLVEGGLAGPRGVAAWKSLGGGGAGEEGEESDGLVHCRR